MFVLRRVSMSAVIASFCLVTASGCQKCYYCTCSFAENPPAYIKAITLGGAKVECNRNCGGHVQGVEQVGNEQCAGTTSLKAEDDGAAGLLDLVPVLDSNYTNQ